MTRARLACAAPCLALFLALFLALAGALPARAAAQGTPAGVGSIRGVIFDSLSGRPLRDAAVFVSGVSRMATTDGDGRFAIDSVPAGQRAVTFSTPSLDSLGLFTMGRDVAVTAGRQADVALATPSFATIWRTLCADARIVRDSGIVYGTVVDAANDTRLAGARVVFTWWDVSKQGRDVSIDRPILVARTDSVGNYYGCGLPADVNLTIDVDAGRLSAGVIETMLPTARLMRRDVLASADMFLSDSARRAAGAAVLDDGLGVRRRGTASLRGEVRDDKGLVVANALVTLPSADTTTRTDSTGRFAIGGLPAGSQLVRVRKLGHGPLSQAVQLRPGRETELSLTLPPATVLAAVNVRADRVNARLAQFDERRRLGMGYYVGERELATKPDVVSALQGLPSLRVQRRGALAQLFFERGANVCVPFVWLNGTPSSVDEITFYRPEDVYGIEIYSNPQNVPAQYQRGPVNVCGALIMWTKDAR